ncbi:MAG: hypothetical protein Q9162_006921 [Coniocarpon cinnabarinum]
METTFITIHDLSPECRILYSSDSIVDVLGYSPEEVVNRSCWDFFHPNELPLAKQKHEHGVALDKAAMLNYCLMKSNDGNYIGCEVVFTVVYDVLVGCTSIYRRGLKSHKRATEAPVVRRLFSTSPKDPRYHMLSHLSSKFAAPSVSQDHEPRAALFLNRFTRTLTIMYATSGLSDLLGMSGEEMKGKSFYFCIQENCLQDAIRCLENAKSNDSIAYLRFWFRDPRHDTPSEDAPNSPLAPMDTDPQNAHFRRTSGEETDQSTASSDRESQSRQYLSHGAQTHSSANRGVGVPRLERRSRSSAESQAVSSDSSVEPMDTSGQSLQAPLHEPDSRTSSGDSNLFTHEAVFGDPPPHESSASSASRSSSGRVGPVELEAVVSCTSDGLVVCLRRAKAGTPISALQAPNENYANGLFAVPWATNPILPPGPSQPHFATQPNVSAPPPATVPQAAQVAADRHDGPPTGSDFMNSIRDIAIFAWALVGINGSLASYGSGSPRGESQPAAGLPIWQPSPDHERAVSTQHPQPEQRSNGYHPVNDCHTAFLRPTMNGNGHFVQDVGHVLSSTASQMDGVQSTAPMATTAPSQPSMSKPTFRQPYQHS